MTGTPYPSLLAAAIDQVADAMIYADTEGTIRLWNHAAERLFGHAAQDVIGASLDVIIPQRFRDAHWRGYREAVARGSTRYTGRAMATKALHKDGSSVYVDLSFDLVRDEAGTVTGVLATTRICATRSSPSN